MSIEGQRLGEFEILECLGQGGMGAVYKARQITLDRFVALKTLQPSIAADPEYIARFRREAKAAAALNHPNLVQVYSAGETEGLHWFAMEFVEGESAQARLRRKGQLEPTEAIAIATHVATALDYAWRKAQLIHRDIKPDNIFLSSDGEVKLGDLGLAKSAGETQSLTTTGSSMGTPHYVSPEQIEGKGDVDLRADIYSLGCTLFHLLSGQPPYSAETAVAVMLRHVTAPVPNLRHVWPACPEELARVVMKMMLKPPAARQQTYGELIADLRGAYDSLTAEAMPDLVAMTQAPAVRRPAAAKPAAARPVRKPRPAGTLAGGILLLLAAVAALCYFAPWKSKAPPSEAKRAADASISPAADGPWQDLLAGINLPGDIRDSATYALKSPGHWELSGGSLRLTSGRGSIVVTPAMVGPNYDVEFRLTRALGAYDAVVGLPVAGRNVLWTTLNKAPCGFEKIGNTDILTGPASVPNPFADGQQHRVLLSVRTLADGQVSLHSTIDGQPSAEWTGPASQLSLHASWEHQPKDRLCLGASGSITGPAADVVFSEVRFRPIAVGAVLPAAGSPASTSPSIAKATKEAPFVNSLGMKFVPVPGTKVLFSIWDTRVQDYATYAGAKQAGASWKNQQKDGVPVSREPEYPVVGVSWEDAQAFCKWLTEKETAEGKLAKGAMYRLPTDEEWSIAVGLPPEQGATPAEKNGKNTVDYPWGVGFPPKGKVGNYRDAAFYAKFPHENLTENVTYTDGFATSSPVGSFPANAFGLYDMGGNVWQWCADWYDATQKDRVLRGACWDNLDRYNLRSSNRKHSAPTPRLNYGYGFRCVLAPSAVENSTTVQSNPAQPAASASTVPTPWKDGIDLMARIDPKRDTVRGTWSFEGGALVGDGDKYCTLQIPYAPLAEYDFRIVFTPVSGHGACQILSKAGHQFSANYFAGTACQTAGFEMIAGQAVWSKQNNTGIGIGTPAADRRYTALVEVRNSGVKSYLDGKLIASWKTDYADMGVADHFKLRSSDAIGLACEGRTAFHRIEVREVSGTGKITADAAPASNATPMTATKDAPFVNTLGMKFVPVPILGGPTGGKTVLFSVWDTRVQDYAVYAAANPKTDGAWKTQNKDGVPVSREPEYPVVGVSWEDAQTFCKWLTEKETTEGKLAKGAKYRLPTDEEWSNAVGLPPEQGATPAEKSAKNKVDFPWGKDFPPKGKVGNYADGAFHANFPSKKLEKESRIWNDWIEGYNDGYATTSPVTSFPANGYGLYDMGGNVWQWCEDWLDASHKNHVIRGAGWPSSDRNSLLSSSRHEIGPPNYRNYSVGFRCVLEPAPSVALAVVAPAAATKDTPYVNTLGMKFVPVPGTKVLFSIWDTRAQDYAVYAAANPKADGGWRTQTREGVPAGREAEHPVVGLNWDDAQAFCQWLTEKEIAEGKLHAGMKYRLPSDAEWSIAGGLPPEPGATPAEKSGKNKVDFPWGKDYPPPSNAGNYADEAYHAKFPPKREKDGKMDYDNWIGGYDDGYATTSPVGSFPANAYGLYDMGGNVYQWCEDWFDAAQKERVLRGASWAHADRSLLLSSSRLKYAPTNRYIADFGFRCVLETAPSVTPAVTTPSAASHAADYPQPAQWIDATAEVRTRYAGGGKLVAEGEWLRGVQAGGVFCNIAAGKTFRNCALRAVFSGRIDLVLALRRSPTNGDTRYGAGIVTSEASIEVDSRAGTRVIGPYVRFPAPLAEGEAHEAVFAAQGGKLTLWLDGKEIATAQDSSFDSGSLAILLKKDARGDCRIRKIEYAELPDSPAPPASPQIATPAGSTPMPKANYPQPAKWTDATSDFRRRYAGKADGLETEGEWLRSATADGVRSIAPGQTFRNCVVRVAFSDRVDLALRRRPAEGDSRYMGSIWTTATKQAAIIAKVAPSWKQITPTAVSAVPLGRSVEHEAVFAVQGDTLTLWLDGRQIAIARDSSLASGSLAVEMTKGDTKGDSRIRKIEYGELPDAPAPAASLTPGHSSGAPASTQRDKP